MNVRSSLPLAALTVSALLVGCADKPAARPPESPVVQTTTAARAPVDKSYKGGGVSVSGEILAKCNVTFSNVDRAPKFDFDQTSLLPQDRDVLSQIATCMTTGPLKGKSVTLVGRADPRGEAEYNMALGEHRAGSVEGYLEQLGIAKARMVETSRGKLDATGGDEAGWQRDRRVDLVLR
jgi:peptidoglycan-associated lipoprotein